MDRIKRLDYKADSSESSDDEDHVHYCRVVPINLPTPSYEDNLKSTCNVQESQF